MKSWLLYLSICLTTLQLSAADAGRIVKATLNGAELVFDADSGTLLRLSHPGAGVLLDASKDRASLIDLAYPIEQFEVLRAAARYSTGAKVKISTNAVEVHWNKLGLSRTNFSVAGTVSATVKIAAAPDGRSLIFTANVHNQSQNHVRQVLFPDLMGLVPAGSAEETVFRTSINSSRPFVDLAPNENTLSLQYMQDAAAFSREYKSGGLFSTMGLRWMDYGSLKGGFNLFAKQWGWDAPIIVRLHLSEVDQKLRLLARHDMVLAPDQKWQSQEFWMTPHAGGWAQGIEPFRAWVKQNYQPQFPLPKRVRDRIGFRTVWMCQTYPHDPKDVIFKFSDLPALAKESAAHGLEGMVVWASHPAFELPLPAPFPHLGTEQDFYDAVKACKQLGVTVSPFVSVVQANKATAPRYGLAVGDNNGWTQHSELVPRWNPPYASGLACVGVSTANELWQQDALASFKKLVDNGVPSLGFDQFWTTTAAEPNMQSLTVKFREYALKSDPDATFCSEQLWNLEIDSGYIDYTWNWGGWRDCGPLTSVLPTPRVNSCVSTSPLSVKKVFADNLYLNLMPRRAEGPNGSGWIKNQPEMSEAVRQCAALKKQFLPYFTEGTFIGNCLLAEPTPGAHTAVYILPNRLLMVLINEGAPHKVSFAANIGAWLKDSRRWKAKSYAQNGRLLSEKKISETLWHGQTAKLSSGEMTLIEVTAGE